MLPRRPVSLTYRLVSTVVLVVIAVTLVAGTITAFAVDRYLTDRLDSEVVAALERERFAPPGEEPGQRPCEDGDGFPGGAIGTLTASIGAGAAEGQDAEGRVVEQGPGGQVGCEPLSSADLAALADLPVQRRPREVELPDGGTFRVAVVEDSDGRFVTGLPTDDVDDVTTTLVALEAALLVLSVLGSVGAGILLVRRQLRPLREVAATAHHVAELPLATDTVDLRDSVPAHLRDERTEVGQVGGALAALLAHVGTSLEARRRSEEQVRRFVADASHELRTPLTTIGGYVQLARRRGDDVEATRTALAKVEEESVRMTSLVEDLLLLARLDAGRPLQRATVDVVRLLVEAVADARVVAGDHHWRLDVGLDTAPDTGLDTGGDAVEVDGDEQRLHQVVTNLLTNARKYTPAGSTVTAGARVVGDDVVLTVHDDGPGFDPDAAGQAFERFTRGDPARNRAGGAGLGLALAQAIVIAHGGTIGLDSVPGDTTLTVRLPVAGRGPATTVDP